MAKVIVSKHLSAAGSREGEATVLGATANVVNCTAFWHLWLKCSLLSSVFPILSKLLGRNCNPCAVIAVSWNNVKVCICEFAWKHETRWISPFRTSRTFCGDTVISYCLTCFILSKIWSVSVLRCDRPFRKPPVHVQTIFYLFQGSGFTKPWLKFEQTSRPSKDESSQKAEQLPNWCCQVVQRVRHR